METLSRSPIALRGVDIWPPISLAPMVGLSHFALRKTLAELGGIGLFFTEMLAAKRLPHDNPSSSPPLIRGQSEHPLFYQLVVGEVGHLPAAIAKLHRLGAAGVDLNLGCPAPTQARQGAGFSLAGDGKRLGRILTLLRQELDLPLTAKIRLGKAIDPQRLADFCQDLEGHGVDLITVHARLGGEKFCRKARWAEVAPAKEAVQIPVFANGGIYTVDDARRCLAESGADGVMLGRGAVTSPWLGREIAEQLFGEGRKNHSFTKEMVYFFFVEVLEERFPPERQLGRLKSFTSYFAGSFVFGHQLFRRVQACASMEEAKRAAAGFFAQAGDTSFS